MVAFPDVPADESLYLFTYEFRTSPVTILLQEKVKEERIIVISVNLQVPESSLTILDVIERRSKPRIKRPFAVTVRGVDADNVAFEVDAVLDNLSTGGLYIRLGRDVAQGAKLFALICFSASTQDQAAVRIAIRGVVLRTEPQPDQGPGVAVGFTRYRLFHPRGI